jgi:hypothetical protein
VTAPSERDYAQVLAAKEAGQDSPARDAPAEVAPAAPLAGPSGGPIV